jgi:hypothetical protein
LGSPEEDNRAWIVPRQGEGKSLFCDTLLITKCCQIAAIAVLAYIILDFA